MIKVLVFFSVILLFGSFSFAMAAPPDAPFIHTVDPKDGEVTIFWDRPRAHPFITDYIIEYHDGNYFVNPNWKVFHDGKSANLFTKITNLDDDRTYWFRVFAVNADGRGEPSNIVSAIPSKPTAPSAPLNLQALPGSKAIKLIWDPPLKQNPKVHDYSIDYKEGGGPWKHHRDGTNVYTEIVIQGFKEGVSYSFRVKAVNTAGSGPWSESASATPYSTPGAPTNLQATSGNTQVELTWTAPSNTGGVPLVDYTIEYKSDSTWKKYHDNPPPILVCFAPRELFGACELDDRSEEFTNTFATITGLENGVKYDFRVRAQNAYTTGPSSNTVSSTPVTVPGPSSNLTGTYADSQVSLSWTPPDNNNGKPIIDYIVQYYWQVWFSGPDWITFNDGTSTNTSTTVTGLVNGFDYGFRVLAVNEIGRGAESNIIHLTPSGIAEPPIRLTAVPGDSQVELKWWPFILDHGAQETDFIIEYSSDGTNWIKFNDGVRTSPKATVTGLTNGTEYQFRVSVVNKNGTSEPTNPVSATPSASLPGVPTNLTATSGDGQVTLSWTAPDDKLKITQYKVEYRKVSSWATFAYITSTGTTATVTGLENDTPYFFKVSAVNINGTGHSSKTITATTS